MSVAATRIELLRGFELRQDGELVDLPLASQRVLAFLALQARPVQRVFVAGNLFTDTSEVQANARLRTVLWRIRQRAGAVVCVTGSRLGLAGGLVVDLHECTHRARRVAGERTSLDDDDLGRLVISGDLLPDWYDDWLLLERERYRQLRLHALEALCRRLAAAHRFAEATDAGLAAIEIEPLRESAHRALIEAYLSEGNACDALRQFRFFADLLRRDLGIEPSDRLRALVRALSLS